MYIQYKSIEGRSNGVSRLLGRCGLPRPPPNFTGEQLQAKKHKSCILIARHTYCRRTHLSPPQSACPMHLYNPALQPPDWLTGSIELLACTLALLDCACGVLENINRQDRTGQNSLDIQKKVYEQHQTASHIILGRPTILPMHMYMYLHLHPPGPCTAGPTELSFLQSVIDGEGLAFLSSLLYFFMVN